jgi:SOS response regulatory protein OraA/RecX
MKNYDINDINELLKKKGINQDHQDFNDGLDPVVENYTIEEFDRAKTRILKYVLYKKRCEKEVRDKFQDVYDENLLDAVVENLKELKYIDDISYIERSINEFFVLKTLSQYEIRYKLLSKGVSSKDIDKYFQDHQEELYDYEVKCAKKIYDKKKKSGLEDIEIKNYLYKKGYKSDSYSDLFKQ